MGLLGLRVASTISAAFLPNSSAEAPAVSLAEHSAALQEELEETDGPQLSTTNVLGSNRHNAARQYKRTVGRFGFALNLGLA